MTTEPGEYYNCQVCEKRYKRREHLQRHRASHKVSRPHQCACCDRTFQRLDVLKRHARICEARAVGLLPQRRRACDYCVRQKKACTADQPCRNCERLAIECCYSAAANVKTRRDSTATTTVQERESTENDSNETQMMTPLDSLSSVLVPSAEKMYSAAQTNSTLLPMDPFEASLWDSAEPTAAWLDYLNPVMGIPQMPFDVSAPQHPAPRQNDTRSYRFYFLDKFTKRTGLLESFECGTHEFREQIHAHYLQQQGVTKDTTLSEEPATSTTTGTPLIEGIFTPSATAAAASTPEPHSWLHDPLTIKVLQIITHVKEVIMIKPRNTIVTIEWSALLEKKCLEFFSPANVRRCLAFYWAIWHPNINLLHKPTFDPTTTSPSLLAAMTIMGASVSPCPSDLNDAKLWFNCVEEMVFTDYDLCSDPVYTLNTGVWTPAMTKQKVQALQAAFIICLLQNWEGTELSKRRIRRFRFATVVSAVRDIDFATARHAELGNPLDFQWKTFVVKEELIRAFLWISLLDHAFVVFNNLPPRFVVKEMRIHLARPEACFHAETADECLAELQAWSTHSPILPTLCISDATEMICKGPLPGEMHRILSNFGALNHFVVISAVHSLVFQHRNSFSLDSHFIAIRHALANWKPIWDLYKLHLDSSPTHNLLAGQTLTPDNAWRRIGFWRHSHDYWLLASIIVDRLTGSSLSTANYGVSPESDYAGSPHREPTGVLTRYDQTSMQQVNELIADFQNIQIFSTAL